MAGGRAPLFRGVGVAAVTLFDDDGRLLAEETAEHAAGLVERGVAAVLVGSSALLSLAGPLGATGALLALANTDAELCIAAFAGDHEAQRALVPGHREAKEDFPGGLKRRLARTAGTSTAVRRGLPVPR